MNDRPLCATPARRVSRLSFMVAIDAEHQLRFLLGATSSEVNPIAIFAKANAGISEGLGALRSTKPTRPERSA